MYNRLIPMIHTVSTSKYNLKRKKQLQSCIFDHLEEGFPCPGQKKNTESEFQTCVYQLKIKN